jgi:hypothetical protein
MMFADHVKLQTPTSAFLSSFAGRTDLWNPNPHTKVWGYFHLSLRDAFNDLSDVLTSGSRHGMIASDVTRSGSVKAYGD